MTTDHDIIARACDIVGLVPCVHAVSGTVMAYCEREDLDPETRRSKGDIYLNNESLHTLLVWRLAKALAARPYAWSEGDTEPTCIVLSTGGHGWCIWRETPDGLEIGLDKEDAGELEEPIDIIRVLVEELEAGDEHRPPTSCHAGRASTEEDVTMSDSGQREMPRYESHKKVWALKIAEVIKTNGDDGPSVILRFEDEGYAPKEVALSYVEKHDPQAGGYYVIYKDGYESWSPAEAFESGYTRID